jgi:hypothetical protein
MNLQAEAHGMMRLIKYDRDPSKRKNVPRVSPWPSGRRKRQIVTFANTSWGPYWVERENIIIVAKGSWLPLVLRRCENYYIFIGACWLIDSQLRDRFITEIDDDPGFSSVMRGSVWDEVGKSCQEEKFYIR